MPELKTPRINRSCLSGRIGNDVTLKYTPSGTAVLNITIASDRSYKKDGGDWETITSWIDCVAWAKQAETIAANACKGTSVYLEGRLETRTWEKDGKKGKAVEIIIDHFQSLERKASPQPAQDLPLAPQGGSDDVPF